MRKEWFFDRFCGAQIAVYAAEFLPGGSGAFSHVGLLLRVREDLPQSLYRGRCFLPHEDVSALCFINESDEFRQ